MDIQELSERANRNEPLPDNLQLCDSLLFLSLRHVYGQFHDGRIDLETATMEKNRLVYQHDLHKRQQDLALDLARHYQSVTVATEGMRAELRKLILAKAPPEKITAAACKLVETWEGSRHV